MQIRLPPLALKSSIDITISPKQGYQWPHKRTCVHQRLKDNTSTLIQFYFKMGMKSNFKTSKSLLPSLSKTFMSHNLVLVSHVSFHEVHLRQDILENLKVLKSVDNNDDIL